MSFGATARQFCQPNELKEHSHQRQKRTAAEVPRLPVVGQLA
uniref:Predicted protein n=1 Tax=Hordeum vulgare subsp. vulgare TaxID=112509 RepID=F2DWB2_HORVV|nr:predicted protein [Hordeum vulgare subsp. vulgare]